VEQVVLQQDSLDGDPFRVRGALQTMAITQVHCQGGVFVLVNSRRKSIFEVPNLGTSFLS